jgi:putative ABC transport system permease protein
MHDWKPEIRERLTELKLDPAREAAVVEELAQDLDDCYEEALSGGATEAEAYRKTVAELSEGESLARELRRVEREFKQEPATFETNRRGDMIADLWRDLRYGARMLRKRPGFTAVAVVTLALGIGANTAMFSFTDAALLKPLAYREPERLVMVWERLPDGNNTIPGITTFQEWRARNHVFSQIAAVSSAGGGLNLTGREVAERVRGAFVSANYFEMLGVGAALGRTFSAEEEQVGKDHVVVLTNRCWRQRFGSDPTVVGKNVTLKNESYTVVGVLPPHRILDRDTTEVWLPLAFRAEQIQSKSHFFTVMARLKPGVTVEQANAEMKNITESLSSQRLTDHENVSAFVQPLRDRLVDAPLRKLLLLLMGATLSILLIGCANVANLLLARGAERQREVAVRATLGAGRARLLRQLLAESALLAAIGGGAGALLAFWLIKGFNALTPRFTIPIEAEATLDWRVLLFTAGVSSLTGILFGLAPAWRATRPELIRPLQERGFGAPARLGRNKLRALLLISEIALTFTLVVGAALLIRSFARLLQVETGFQTDHLLTFRVDLDKTRYPQGRQLATYQTELLGRLRALPGAQSAAVANVLPLNGASYTIISIPGQSPGAAPIRAGVGTSVISAGYFETLGVRLRRGRLPSERDTGQTAPVAVINQAMANRHWPDRDPVGGQIQFAGDDFASLTFTVIGVVADIKQSHLIEESNPTAYILFAQTPEKAFSAYGRSLNFAVRTTTEPAALTATIRSLAAGVDRDLPLYGVKTMEELYSDSVASPRFQTALFSLFGALALGLAAVGLYGVMAYSATQRTHEIGVRMALGARPRDVMRLVLGQGAFFTITGLAIGGAASAGLSRYLGSFLYEIKPNDAGAHLGVSLLLGGVALLACYLPARQATKVDPMRALRHE